MSQLPVVPIVPNGLRYWVLPDKQEETKINVGGVTLTGGADHKEPPAQGRIVAVGDATKMVKKPVTPEPGEVAFHLYHEVEESACKYKRDDLVIFGKYAGVPHKFNDEEYTILAEEEILGLVIETPFDPRDNTPLDAVADPELR